MKDLDAMVADLLEGLRRPHELHCGEHLTCSACGAIFGAGLLRQMACPCDRTAVWSWQWTPSGEGCDCKMSVDRVAVVALVDAVDELRAENKQLRRDLEVERARADDANASRRALLLGKWTREGS